MTVQLHGIHLISFVGRQGSGKTHLGKTLAHTLSCGRIEVSDVVRSLNKGLSRKDLPATAKKTAKNPEWLGEKVSECLAHVRDEKGGQVLVLTGCRERALHKYLEKCGLTLHMYEIHAEPFTRCERVLRMGKVKSEVEFLDHEVRETKMGIKQVLDDARTRVITTDTTDASDLVNQVIKHFNGKKP